MHPREKLLERAATAEVGAAATAGLAVGLAGGAAYGWPAALGAGEHALPASAVQDVRSNNMNNATQPQHFTLRSGSSTSGASGADQSAPPLLEGLNPVTLPQS